MTKRNETPLDSPQGYYTKSQIAGLYGVSTRTVDVRWRGGKMPKPINSRSLNRERNRRLWSKEEVDHDLDSKGLLPSPVSVSSKMEKAIYVLASRLKGMEF